METSSYTTDLLCFHSSNCPCASPKSVSGSVIGKIFCALFQIHHKTIIWCLSIFSGVYLVNGRRCRCCISFVRKFWCTFIQQVQLRLPILKYHVLHNSYLWKSCGYRQFILDSKNFCVSLISHRKPFTIMKQHLAGVDDGCTRRTGSHAVIDFYMTVSTSYCA